MPGSLLPGTPVPDLNVPLLSGGRFRVSGRTPGFMTLVEFYRGRHCPRCHRHLLSLQSVLPRLADRGVEVVAISMDSEARAREAKADWGLQSLEIGYDLDMNMARTWGLYISKPITDSEPRPFNEPATFWVRPDGTLYAATYATTPFSRPHWTDWLEALDVIRSRDYPPRGGMPVSGPGGA